MSDYPLSEYPPLTGIALVLGGARSGKSQYAEGWAMSHGDGLYLATAEPGDAEMAERIRQHRERRGARWTTKEEPIDIAVTIAWDARPERVILVDCLTLWLSNLMEADQNIDHATLALLQALESARGPVILVSNEVGLGIVPDNQLARRFMDCAGRLNQVVAGVADQVVFMAAGLPMVLKGERR